MYGERGCVVGTAEGMYGCVLPGPGPGPGPGPSLGLGFLIVPGDLARSVRLGVVIDVLIAGVRGGVDRGSGLFCRGISV